MSKLSLKNRKTLIKWSLITIAIIGLAFVAYKMLKPKEKVPNYITAIASTGDIENNVMASGKVKALNTVDVGAQVSGEVTKLFVKVGDNVQKGDLIAQIDQVTQNNNLSNQQATLQQRHANLQSAQADYLSYQASLESAHADLASREAELKQATVDFERLRPLLDMQAISEKEFYAAQTNVETASARVANAQAAIKSAQAALIKAESNIVSNQADLQKAQTNLNTANQDLGYTTIRAPINGTVVSVSTEQGSMVNANQSAPTIVTLADLSTIRINAQISEADVVNVQAGMPVYFNTIGNPDKKYDAVITAIEPAPERISSTSSTDAAIYYIGYVEVPNPERRFRIDMTAQVYVVVDQAKNAILAPSAAVKRGVPSKEVSASNASIPPENSSNSTHYVRILNKDGTIENRAVKVGIDNRVNVQILSGLSAGEEIIISDDSNHDGSNGRTRGKPPM